MKKGIKMLSLALIMMLLVSGCGSANAGNTQNHDLQNNELQNSGTQNVGESELKNDETQEMEDSESQNNGTQDVENSELQSSETENSEDSELGTEETNDSESIESATEDEADDSENTEVLEETETSEENGENDAEVEEDITDIKIPETETIMYAQTAVNVRSLPSTDGEKLGTLRINEQITALGEAVDGWQMVRYKEKIAYVSAKYLGTKQVEIQTPEPNTNVQAGEITAEQVPLPGDFDPNGIVVVIDAGHQGKGNYSKEPDGPGSGTMKAKVASGTQGVATGIPEYQLTLTVSMKLRDELRARGYQVVMVRETHNINISNSERAKVANNLGADAFIRIHADGSEKSSAKGAMTICQTSSNPYNASYYSESRRLSDCVIQNFVANTGAKSRGVWETDTMSGINWCQVPVTILEMGFMSNPEEDVLMASDDYQNKMVKGIADGIDAYFGR